MSNKKGKKENNFLFTKNALLSIVSGGLIVLSLIGSSIYADVKIKEKANNINLSKKSTIKKNNDEETVLGITSTPTPKIVAKTNNNQNKQTNTSNVECIGPDGKQFWTSMDDCKKLNEKWGKQLNYVINCKIAQGCNRGGETVRMSKNRCNLVCGGLGANTNSHGETSQQTNSNNDTSSYPPCTVYYPSSKKSYTYNHISPEQCQLWNKEAKEISNTYTFTPTPIPTYTPYVSPTITENETQRIIDQHNAQVKQCRRDIASRYTDYILNNKCNFGDNSATRMCLRIYGEERETAYNDCGTTY